jgi:hypothetical protein
MKKIKINFVSIKDKELFFKVALVSTLAIGVTVNMSNRKYSKVHSFKIDNIYNDRFGNFDKVNIPNKPPIIARMISVLRPNFSSTERHNVAVKIHQALTKYQIPPQIVVAIIDTESNFNQDVVSSTGDLSMAQVNAEVWNKEFLRMNLGAIDIERLKADESYSLEVMTQILHILKTRYEKKDRRWYARYHSRTEKHKKVYLLKLESRLKQLENANLLFKTPSVPRLVAL